MSAWPTVGFFQNNASLSSIRLRDGTLSIGRSRYFCLLFHSLSLSLVNINISTGVKKKTMHRWLGGKWLSVKARVWIGLAYTELSIVCPSNALLLTWSNDFTWGNSIAKQPKVFSISSWFVSSGWLGLHPRIRWFWQIVNQYRSIRLVNVCVTWMKGCRTQIKLKEAAEVKRIDAEWSCLNSEVPWKLISKQ